MGEWYRFVDLDADGDVDLLAEQPFSNIRFYRNTGTKQAAQFEPGGILNDTDGQPLFLDRQNIPAIVDLDCDGRLDLFIGRVEGLVTRYEADAPGSLKFAFLTDHFEDIEIIGRGPQDGPGPSMRHGANALAFADFDDDRDLDLFWGDFFEPGMLLIQNIGATCSTPSFRVEPVPLPYARHAHQRIQRADARRRGLRRRSRLVHGRHRRLQQSGDDGGRQLLFLGAHGEGRVRAADAPFSERAGLRQ